MGNLSLVASFIATSRIIYISDPSLDFPKQLTKIIFIIIYVFLHFNPANLHIPFVIFCFVCWFVCFLHDVSGRRMRSMTFPLVRFVSLFLILSCY
jgi:energy-coupling factor transporter transmembrane protein EcfT